MVDANSPQLKRKRESVGAQRKPKRQREAGQDAGAGEDVVAPVAAPVKEAQTATAKSTSKSKSRKAQTNGAVVETPPKDVAVPVQEVQPTQTPTGKSKSKSQMPRSNSVAVVIPARPTTPTSEPTPQSKGLPNGESEAAGPTDTSSHTKPKRQSKKDRTKGAEANLPAGTRDAANATETPTTQAPASTQLNATDEAAKKQIRRERVEAKLKKSIEKKEKESSKQDTAEARAPKTAEKADKKDSKNKRRAPWNASPAQGGWFLPQDPVFSSDEQHIILATSKAVQIYTAETSLLARALPITRADTAVTAFALSATKPNHLYVADSSRLISLWDWVQGTKLGRWQMAAIVREMVVIAQPGSAEDLVYCNESNGKSQTINVHALRTKEQASKTELKQVLKQDDQVHRLQVLLQGKYVIITSARSITIGKRLRVSHTALKDFEYVWRELQFSTTIATCDAYYRPPILAENGKITAAGEREIIDLAVGDEIGVVLLFEDILASFAASERFQKNQNTTEGAEDFRPKRLHWHRNAVGAVKWSLDGNYLISGGDETVLTIWQLATGKPQHLPHLTAAIENVVISPSGSSYALSLANNSVIVLSTAELEAKTNIVGIQSRRMDTKHLVVSKNILLTDSMLAVPIAVDPKNAQQVLCAVPSSQPRQGSEVMHPSPYLQTFDFADQRPIARQALTRNNATDPNQGPGGKRILEPDVHLLQISHDGKYLATVDEWLPPLIDMNYIDEGEKDALEEERLRRREVHLKIWMWDEERTQWALETRIDAPHFLEDASGNGRVLDMVVNPKDHGFATIGEDHVVRVWTPKTKSISGVVRRGASEEGTVTWTLHRSITLPDPSKTWLSDVGNGPTRARTLRLAYSADGSILAAGVSGASNADPGLIHLIDIHSATIRRSMTEIDTTVLCGLGIVGHFLVAVTECITVWDIVSDNLVYCASIETPGFDAIARMSVVRLAINEASGTFAVSLPQVEKVSTSEVRRVSSELAVYDTNHGSALWSSSVGGITLGLAAQKGNGYVTLDSDSCIRTISPVAGTIGLPAPQLAQDDMESAVEEEVIEEDMAETRLELEDTLLENEYDRPVVTQQDLEEIFHNESAPKAPQDVFSAVLRLFGGAVKAAA